MSAKKSPKKPLYRIMRKIRIHKGIKFNGPLVASRRYRHAYKSWSNAERALARLSPDMRAWMGYVIRKVSR
jgi:hypothetical protein